MKSVGNGTKGNGALTLEEWINELGPNTVAKLMKVEPSAVRHWRRGYCLPRSEQMMRIHKFSRGRVTYAEMIESFYRGRAKLAKKSAHAK